jgi:hypothetical protein
MEWVEKHFEMVLIAIVFISVLPMAVEYVLARRRGAAGKKAAASVSVESVQVEKKAG